MTWDRASIADVVAGFAAFSGRTIIIGKDIKGEVTAEVKNQPWPQAFQAILAAPGPLGPGDGGRHHPGRRPVALAALDSLEPLETSVVRINYAQAGSLAKTHREHPHQGPRPRRGRHRLQLAHHHRHAQPGRPA